MDGYEAEMAAFDSAVAAATSAGEQVGAVDLEGSMSQAKDGMPGSLSAQSIGMLADSWGYQRTSWQQSARGYAEGLGISKREYENSEQAAAAAFSGYGR
jgi:hypothetical protein